MQKIVDLIHKSWKEDTFVKIQIVNKIHKNDALKSVLAKRITLKNGDFLSFNFRYNTKDETKNFTIEEGVNKILKLLTDDFKQADCYTTIADWNISCKNGSSKLNQKPPSITSTPSKKHNKEKNRLISSQENIYLFELGVVTGEGKIKNNKQDKFRQINKYIEIVDGILRQNNLEDDIHIVDMGAGKGYLTFALYDYLYNVMGHKKTRITGIELRKELVDKCNLIAEKSSFDNLSFIADDISNTDQSQPVDVLIALHACDTATDEAMYFGIQQRSKIIICAPCCHKQVRNVLSPTNELSAITQFGIMKERQSELLTDSIRALSLEAFGYKTKVFEFISTEHTPKNVLIVGAKQVDCEVPIPQKRNEIESIKKLYGIDYQHLERKLFKEK